MKAVAILHGRPALWEHLADSPVAPVVVARAVRPDWPPLCAAVIDSALRDWADIAAQLRRRDPGLRLAVIADGPESAMRAVNELGIDRLLFHADDVEASIVRLRQQPLSDAQQLEREVQTRTAILQQVKLQWEQSFDAVQDPMAIVDSGGGLIRLNRAYARHMGCTLVDAPGQRCFELRAVSMHVFPRAADGMCVSCPLARNAQQRGPAHATIEDSWGLRWEVSTYPVDMPGQPDCAVVHYRDVTEQLERLAKIARADRTSAVGKLAGAIAHELNSPMTSVMVFSEVLANKTEERPELNEHASEIFRAAQQCRRLIQGLLRFARRPRGRDKGSVDLPAVVAEVQPLVQHRIDVSQVALVLDLPADVKPVHAHVMDVEHLLVDLLTNALEACSTGDTITIAARNDEHHGEVELSIRDTGHGMSPEVLQEAFDPFFSTKPRGQAAGLGLTTCEAMVAEMGGTMGLQSAPGEGTQAWVRLPIARG